MTTPLRCVVDTSVCIKQFISDPLTPKVNQLFDHLANPETEFFVPDLFYIECANTLWKYIRAGLYTAAAVQADLATLKGLPLHVVSTADLMEDAVSIGLAYGISAYDASYVALSQQVNAMLLTLDQKLVRATASAYDVRSLNDFSVPPV
ncbi:MAG: type II toxin-antitoxin system VapC family toxin, partial [Microcoleus sp. SIO2G3]|nr:type II toxin-antitoxin system VapC family toxin [Microcoleus sp. SIO2G3]